MKIVEVNQVLEIKISGSSVVSFGEGRVRGKNVL